MDPRSLNKYLYVENTPTWLVKTVYFFGIVAWALVIWGFSGIIVTDPIYRSLFAPLLFFTTVYHFISYGINLFYKQFDLLKHSELFERFWSTNSEPTVDIFLPICGEDLSILKNTWKHVARLSYVNKQVYVLDDTKTLSEERRRLASKYGFNYIERPNKGELKKAGNLKYAYKKTNGDFIVIFDADFAPHPDFLIELIPYMSDSNVAIIQTPQYFQTSAAVHKRSPLEYGAAYVQEDFYRIIQVARNRLGGALCCGSNAIYRRSALDEIGGTVQIEHSEDAHTGFALTDRGWKVLYLPIILAIGLCPHDLHAYFHQQHRWCSGSMSLLRTKRFWVSSLSWKQKLCYCTGFLYYLHHPVGIAMSFQLFITLFLYNEYMGFANALPFYPYLIFSFVALPLTRIPRLRWGVFLASVVQLYSYSHATLTAFSRSSVGWIPTNAQSAGVSSAFRQTTVFVGAYLFVYLAFVAVAVRIGAIQVFEYMHYSVQFWIFWNVVLSGALLWYLYRTMERARRKVKTGGVISMGLWQMRTAGLYAVLTSSAFIFIVFY